MAEKLLAVLQVLKDRGWKAHARLDLQGWGIYIDYIDQGPVFGLLIRLDPLCWSPYLTYEQIADRIMEEALDEVEVCYGPIE